MVSSFLFFFFLFFSILPFLKYNTSVKIIQIYYNIMENLTCGKDIFRETTRVTQATSSSYFTKVRYLVTWHNLGTKHLRLKKTEHSHILNINFQLAIMFTRKRISL